MTMNKKISGYFNTIIILSFLFLLILSGCGKSKIAEKLQKADTTKTVNKALQNSQLLAIALPPFSEGIYPCSKCHAKRVPNTERRELKWHLEINKIYNHDKENRWCLDCHDAKNRDSLRLASGKLLDFKRSYKLCGQCHGDKLRDWKVGVHGKRTGYWNGKKQYFLCVNCHNPHSPRFKPIKPEPAPVRQEDIRSQN